MATPVKITITAEDGSSRTFLAIGQNADKMAKQIETGATKSAKSLDDMEKKATAVGAAIGTLAAGVIKSGQAAQKEELQSRALTRAYGDQAVQIEELAQQFQDMGIASDDSTRIAALGAQSLIKNYALTSDEIQLLIERSADLAQVTFDQYGNQLELTDVMQRVSAAIRGEAESAEILGVALNDQRLAALAAAEGLDGWTTTMTDAEKAAFRLQIFLQDTATAEGAAAERSEDLSAKVNAMKLNILDASAGFGRFLGPLGESAAVLGDVALAAPLAGAAIGRLAAGARALSVAWGPLGLVLAAGAAAFAIYELTQRQDENEVQVKALTEATDAYTQSIADNTTALVKAGTYDYVQNTKEFLDLWINNGLIAHDRIMLIQGAIDQAFTVSAQGGGNGFLASAFQEDGKYFDAYIDQILAQNQAYADGIVTVEEMQAAQTELAKGFSITAGAATAITTALDNLDDDIANPLLDGKAIAQEADQIVRDYLNNVISLDQAIHDLNQLPLNPEFNLALQEQAKNLAETSEEANRAAGSYKLIADNIDDAGASFADFAVKGASVDEVLKAQQEAAEALNDDLAALATTLEVDLAGAADAAYNRVVGFTDGMVSSIQTIKDWSDNLTGDLGTNFLDDGSASALQKLLDSGKLDIEDQTEAIAAQTQIYEDLARATEAAQIIQIKQIDTLADGTKATADYIVNLSEMNEGEQAIALAWADQDLAQRAKDIADMSANLGTMNETQKDAFSNMVTSAAAVDPALALILEDMGLIKASTLDPTGWEIVMPTDGAQATLGDVVDVLQEIADLIAQQYNLEVTTSFDTSSFWQAYNALPNSRAINVYTVSSGGYGFDPNTMSGGIPGFAGGGSVLTRMAEMGPEQLLFPNGQVGMAWNDGMYSVPRGTYVSPAAPTEGRMSGRGGGGITIHGPIYITPATPDLHEAITGQLLNQGI